MPKQTPKIRWRNRDTDELQRVINNFNAKIYRLRRNHPELIDFLPNTVNKTGLKAQIQTRADFNETIASLKRFSLRGAEKPAPSNRGRKTTQWADAEQARKNAKLNKIKEKALAEIQNAPVTSRGVDTGKTRAEMGTIKENSLKPITRNPENMTQKEWDYFVRTTERALDPMKNTLDRINMKLNYIKGLYNAGFSDDVVDLVRQVDPDQFVYTVNTDEQATYEFIYDPIEFELKERALIAVWEKALDRQRNESQQAHENVNDEISNYKIDKAAQ